MIKTSLFEVDGSWWFRWRNFADADFVRQRDGQPWKPAGAELAHGQEGPFQSKAGAQRACNAFKEARAKKYPFERVEEE